MTLPFSIATEIHFLFSWKYELKIRFFFFFWLIVVGDTFFVSVTLCAPCQPEQIAFPAYKTRDFLIVCIFDLRFAAKIDVNSELEIWRLSLIKFSSVQSRLIDTFTVWPIAKQ